MAFKDMIYAAASPRDRHFDDKGYLKGDRQTKLVNALNSDPDSDLCDAIISSFNISQDVYQDRGRDNTNGAIFYVHVWWPNNPYTGSNPNLSNPYRLRIDPYITYATGYTYFGRFNGEPHYVSAFFYRPGF